MLTTKIFRQAYPAKPRMFPFPLNDPGHMWASNLNLKAVPAFSNNKNQAYDDINDLTFLTGSK